MWALMDGSIVPLEEARFPVTDPGFTRGWTVFETMRVQDGAVPLLRQHLERLQNSASEACIPFPDGLEDEVRRLAAMGHGPCRLRITLSGSGRHALTLHPLPKDRWGAPVRCITGPHVDDPFLPGSVKHGSRAGWVVAVRRAGVDEVLLVDAGGRFTEGTTSGILAVYGGTVFTAPHDGRILPSTTVNQLLEAATTLGIPVVREGALAHGPLDGLYIASATRGLAPVIALDGVPLPGWEPIGRDLAAAIRAASIP